MRKQYKLKIFSIIGIIAWLFFPNDSFGQWKEIFAGSGLDIARVSGQSSNSYKGISGASFVINTSLEKRKTGSKYSLMLRTGTIRMRSSENYQYIHRPGLKEKVCLDGKVTEREKYGFYSSEIGIEPFERIVSTAWGTFKITATIFIKDEKYVNDGYRIVRVFNNVKADEVYWEEEINGDFDVEEVHLVAELVTFTSYDDHIFPLIQNRIDELNAKAEAECNKAAENEKARELKKQKEEELAKARAKEIEDMKSKLGGTASISGSSAAQNGADDFWSGNEEAPKKHVRVEYVKVDDDNDFWSGNDEKKLNEKRDDFWQGGVYTYFSIEPFDDNYETSEGFYNIQGKVVSSEDKLHAMIIGEDYSHPFEVINGNFKITLLLRSGVNKFKIKINDHEEELSIRCNRKPVKLRASLIWNTVGTDIDLQMIDPSGKKCSYENKHTGSMKLDVDNTNGYGPENIYVNGVLDGKYIIKIHNYGGGINTQATIYIYIDESLSETKTFKFTSNKELIQVAELHFE